MHLVAEYIKQAHNYDVPEIIQINNKLGKNTVKIVNGGVLMENANCLDKICVKAGFINKPGQSIVCLPHKLVIDIIGNRNQNQNNKVDGISY